MAAAWASLTNRLTALASNLASRRRNLIATLCFSTRWVALMTTPIPPSPRTPSIRYFSAITVPIATGTLIGPDHLSARTQRTRNEDRPWLRRPECYKHRDAGGRAEGLSPGDMVARGQARPRGLRLARQGRGRRDDLSR